jgi:hypothetical protein
MRKGQKHTPEAIEKNRIAHLGKKLTTEHRAKIILSNTGRFVSEKTRARISAAKMGHSVSMETRKKMSDKKTGKNHYNYGKHLSKEIRNNIRLASLGKQIPEEVRHKISVSLMGKMAGDKNPNWKGGRNTSSGGYELIRIYPQFCIAVHRQIMERVLGRKLQKGEVVHHVNRRRRDNQAGNLVLCNNQAAHMWCHSEEARIFLGA